MMIKAEHECDTIVTISGDYLGQSKLRSVEKETRAYSCRQNMPGEDSEPTRTFVHWNLSPTP